ncbi:MAG: sulfate adenylyltransferase subunit CysN [Ilumatobacteraceae bacterium]|nr:sulfate adenylyltransferase subunit CysN [Ilumatobacteraceae bacterium]
MRSSNLPPNNPVSHFIKAQQDKDLLRFIVCGSVDDGKSSMIGRLLYDSKQIFDDQLASLANDSLQHGTQGEAIDFALLTDGLQAEREQGITIDVAYRFFATDKRAFIVADAPGHEQYTRNMVTGASTAEMAVVLIDARKGVLTQTRRHSLLVDLLGIKNIIVAINKIDLIDYSQEVFDGISQQYLKFAETLHFENIHFVPICALTGENLTLPSTNTPWYSGPRLIEIAETVAVGTQDLSAAFRMSVQSVSRPNSDFRGYMGTIASGEISVGDRIRVNPSGMETRVKDFADFDGPRHSASAGESVCLVLEDEIDISRGDLLSSVVDPALVSDHVEVHLVWLAEEAMIPQRSYLLKIGSKEVRAHIDRLKYRIDINSNEHVSAVTLGLNDIGICNISTVTPIGLDPYDLNRSTGAFVLIDRITNRTVGAGMIRHSLRRSENVQWQELTVGREQRELMNEQQGFVVWLTGLSGSGKSTLANALEVMLHQRKIRTFVLDGDNVRHGLNADLGFTETDRAENIRRVAEVAKLFVDAGMVTIVSFISPFEAERSLAREIIGESDFFEVFVDAPMVVVEKRDTKGLYAKARAGLLPNFTGVDSPYEIPTNPNLRVESSVSSVVECLDQIVAELVRNRFL